VVIAAADLNTWQADTVSAFINPDLDELVYIQYPDRFERSGYILKVNKGLYGLRWSPLLWLNDQLQILRELGLEEVPGVPCLFINRHLIDCLLLCR
jgi:hypothetical protein